MSGTTAIAVLVRGASLVVANVGDSRAVAGVLDERGEVVAMELSKDQTPFRKDEYERVRRCGARVLSVDQVEGNKDPEVQRGGRGGGRRRRPAEALGEGRAVPGDRVHEERRGLRGRGHRGRRRAGGDGGGDHAGAPLLRARQRRGVRVLVQPGRRQHGSQL
ncbi:uncharacterized protein M6B38_136660 [Iris pallida]|uniref:protein-serine/threonine phosphatase n=1 Tax=Iris pallida TaxID=29817 RepID=A0AAX6FEW0_IRIPA|nr:uncharacterized protein M6B38_165740 [Iris pallida]KAJ6814922.1 uncharacterized protein M6B38_136660 [Iris pallida]